MLNSRNLELLYRGRDSKGWIAAVVFSPDGSKLALASADNAVYIYDAKNGFALLFTCEGHSSGVRHLDFSLDSQFMQSCSAEFEIVDPSTHK